MSGIAFQGQGKPIRSGFFNRTAFRSAQRSTLILTTGTTGVRYFVDEFGMGALPKPGTELLLVREPDRDQYTWTVAAYLDEETKLGYIIEYKREMVARLMDLGFSLRAVVVDAPSEEQEKRIRKKYNRPIEEWLLTFDVFWEEPSDAAVLSTGKPILLVQTAIEDMDKFIDFDAYKDRLGVGTELQLYRDTHHEYDAWAIDVYLDGKTQIGRVSPYKNDGLAHLMDAGKPLRAVINEPVFKYMTDPQYGLWTIPVGIEPNEDWRVPFEVYLG